MKLINNSCYNLQHCGVCLEVGKTAEVAEDLAKVWLKYEGVIEVPQSEPSKVSITTQKQSAKKTATKSKKTSTKKIR